MHSTYNIKMISKKHCIENFFFTYELTDIPEKTTLISVKDTLIKSLVTEICQC